MATFTPYDRTIKETITVDFQDRKTLQRVEFENELNVYRGRFVGTAKLVGNGNDSTIQNYGIVDSTLSGCGFVDENGFNESFSGFHGKTISSLIDLSSQLQDLSGIVMGPLPGFEIETISANEGLSSVWDRDADPGELTSNPETLLSVIRYIYQTLGQWQFNPNSSSLSDEWLPASGGYQPIRY